MNTYAVNEFIAKSQFHDWYMIQEIEFNLPYINFSKQFKGVSAFHEFVDQQLDAWNKLDSNLPNEFKRSKDFFHRLYEEINSLFDPRIEPVGRLTSKWNQIKEFLITNIKNVQPFVIGAPETDFLLFLFKEYPERYIGCLNYFTGNISNAFNNKERLVGFFLAYEFDHQDKSEIFSRRKSEKSTLSQIKAATTKYLNESEEHLNSYIKRTNDNFDKINAEVLKDKENNKNEYNEWYVKVTEEQIALKKDYQDKIKELETTYKEKLRLQKPADYWAKRAMDLKKEGWSTLKWLVGLIGLACLTLYYLLWKTPEGMLKAFFDGDTSTALRWSIVFVTFISFLFFGIRILMKVTFSSFHLARDAEERERLTYVYLAMVKDSSIEKEDRHLIMQSLFSRADTGLLKDEGGPTMPGGIWEKISK